MTTKPVKFQEEYPARCTGEGKQSKGNYQKRKGQLIPPIAFCDEVPRRRGEGKGEEGGRFKHVLNT